jgi:predicted transcriptional regulator
MAEKSILKVSVRQMKAARSLLAWSQEDLAEKSQISLPTVKRLEASDGELGGRLSTTKQLIQTLTRAGVEFIPENGGGAGVRLKKRNPS